MATRLLAATSVLLIAGHITAFAATTADYRARVESARGRIDALFQDYYEAGDDDIRGMITEVKAQVPATETIKLAGGTSVETDNRWLAARLEDFTNETDETVRFTILTEISDRLASIAESVKQVDEAAAAETSKDQNKQKLAEILRREEYQKAPPKDKSFVQKWIDDFIAWLAKIFPRPSLPSGAESGFGTIQFGLQLLIYAIVIALLGFLLYKLVPLIKGAFGRNEGDETSQRVILGERIGDDESAGDLFSEAEQLARDGDLRAAIRKGYIALLCDLGDRKIIRLARHKTNRDYLKDVRKDERLFEKVNGLTRRFEQNWYGLTPAAPADWEEFRGGYYAAVEAAKR